jgi:hypothetical protein
MNIKDNEIKNEELNEMIDCVCAGFVGQLDDLSAAVGLIVSGQLFGWRVMRLVCSRRHWMLAAKLFGDPKKLMPERGKYYNKSLGMKVIDKTGDYWDFVAGNVSRDHLPLRERKMVQ